ncbi:unnamed protein product [Rhizophagus irregularis]|uniref:BTB-domain-containing protein n=1 Tax=Rhizophagus irregularis TaxID=588596 RepID=A0A2N1NL11_9GLOM|nr:BTB-domain-containing protein [Rhizophagus irregularis]CAB4399568.1 unnamed protein product [Rhizophagus irregularis]
MEFIELYPNFYRDLSNMLTDARDHDVIIQVGENQNRKELRAHSNILRARSEYFKIAFSDGWIIKKNDIIEFKKPNINPTVFEAILEYIYTGEFNLREKSVDYILQLIVACDELLLEELLDCAQDCLIKIRPTLVREELFLVLHTVFPLINCKKLQDHCVKFASAELQSLNISKEILSFDEDILYELLKRDDFLIEEAIVWDYLIKWGIEQTPGLESRNRNRSEWNNENFEALKRTLSRFIPLIRFTEISSDDFLDKIRPFKAIIPRNIYEEIMKFHMKRILPTNTIILPPRVGMIDIKSKIIKPKLAYIIANWIEKKDATAIRSRNSQYKFNLLYRSSNDSLHINSFRYKCKNHGPCFILIKPKTNEFDGHLSRNITSQSSQQRMSLTSRNAQSTNWDNPGSQKTLSQISTKIYGEYYSGKIDSVWKATTENFIFSFANDNDTKDMKICRMNYHDVTYNTGNYKKLCFGFAFKISRQHLYINNSYYNDDNVLKRMLMPVPEEIEVFEIISS